MKTIRVTFKNGQQVETSINGTGEQIKAYYMGKEFNLGHGENDLLSKAVNVEVLD